MKKSFEMFSAGSSALKPRRLRSAEFLRLDPLRVRRVGNRLAMLVGAGQEEDVLPSLAHVPRDNIGSDLLVGVAQVRHTVDVVDRSGDVKGHHPAD